MLSDHCKNLLMICSHPQLKRERFASVCQLLLIVTLTLCVLLQRVSAVRHVRGDSEGNHVECHCRSHTGNQDHLELG